MSAVLSSYKSGMRAVWPPLTFFLVIMFVIGVLGPLYFLLLSPEWFSARLTFVPINATLAWFTAGTARVVVSHPFSFTLPRQLAAIRQQLLIVGLSANAAIGLLLLLVPMKDPGARLQIVEVVVCGGMATYLAICVLAFRVIRAEWLIIVGTMSSIVVTAQYAPAVAFAEFVVGHPTLVMLVAALLLVPFWRLFSRRDVSRRLMGRVDIEVPYGANHASSWERAAASLTNQRKLSGKGEADWFVALHDLLTRRHSSPLFCFRHQCLLALRKRQLTLGSFQPIPTLLFVLMVALVAKTPAFPPYGSVLMFVFSFSVFWGLQPIVTQSPLLPYRRADLAAATVLMGLVVNLYCIALGLLILPVYWLADLVSSERDFVDLLWRNPDLEPGVTPLHALGYFSLFVPIALTIKLFRPFWLDGVGAAATVLFMVVVAILADMFFDDYMNAGSLPLLAWHLGGWLIYAPVAFWYFRTHDLSEQPRS